MFKLPFPEIIEKIKIGSGLSEGEINQKIDSKMGQLAGLISKEGAAHIVANELGVKLFEQPTATGKLKIKNILAGMRSVETVGKVVKKYELREFEREGRKSKVANFLMGDETGIIKAVLWGEQTDNFSKFNEGDVIHIQSAYVKENLGKKEMHLNDRSKVLVNPQGIDVGEVSKSETVRKLIKDLQSTDSNVDVLGTIVQIFEPKFYEVCPDCSKRMRLDETSLACPIHGVREPDYGYVMNVVLDDGTGTLRIVFFRDQVHQLLGKTKQEVMHYKDNPVDFESIKHDLLGHIVKISGRATQNAMFDRTEMISQNIEMDPNPDEEIKRLDQEMEKVVQ